MLTSTLEDTVDSLPTPGADHQRIEARPVEIRWDESMPVFAKGEFLCAAGDDYGWLGGIDEFGQVRCILPYTIVHKTGLRMVRFRDQAIPVGPGLDVREEKSFLDSVVRYFRNSRADVIIPPTNNALFRAFPDGAQAAPYGSYVIDLQESEDALWKKVSKTTRQNINTARKDGVTVREGMEFLDPAYDLIRETFSRSKLPFMSRSAFTKFASSFGEHGKVLMAEHAGKAQSFSFFAFSKPCAYWIYGGNIQHQHQGAMKLLQWEAIRNFRNLGVEKFDFFGARIDPPKGSKQEGINLMKKNLGASLCKGYVWKYSLRPWRAWVYSSAVRFLRGGDIVDQEGKKLADYPAGF